MKLFLKLLATGFTQQGAAKNAISEAELYKELNLDTTKRTLTNTMKREHQIQGLGKYFKKGKRPLVVQSALNINDDQGTVTIKNVDQLKIFAQYLIKGEKSLGINQNIDKAALCYALICHHYEAQGMYKEALEILATVQALYPKEIDPVPNMAIEGKKLEIEARLLSRKENKEENKQGTIDENAVRSFLEKMAGIPATLVGRSTLQKKRAQAEYFKDNLIHLSANQLAMLLNEMREVKNNDKYFGIIRTERWSLFGGGNTDTWQEIFSAAKMQFLQKLGDVRFTNLVLALKKGQKVDPTHQVVLSKGQYDIAKLLVSKHGGRFYAAWGSTRSATLFGKCFKVKEEENQNQNQNQNSK